MGPTPGSSPPTEAMASSADMPPPEPGGAPASSPDAAPGSPLEVLFAESAERLAVAGNEPIRLDTTKTVWLVAAGKIEIFAVGRDQLSSNGEFRGARTHIATLEAQQMLFGIGAEAPAEAAPFGLAAKKKDASAALFAVGLPGTCLWKIDAAALTQRAQEDEHIPLLETAIESWLAALFSKVPRAAAPQSFQELRPGSEVVLIGGEEGQDVARTADGVVWVRHVEGASHFLGLAELPLELSDFLVPISDETWLTSPGETTLSCVATVHVLKSGSIWEGLGRFHRLFLQYLQLQLADVARDERRRLERRLELDRKTLESSYSRLASVLGVVRQRWTGPRASADPLFAACQQVGASQGLRFRAPAPGRVRNTLYRLNRICAASRLRMRRVILRDDWWNHDNGPFLGFLSEKATAEGVVERYPVALIPTSPTSYELVDPAEPQRVAVDEPVAAELEGIAFMFYPSFAERPVRKGDLLRLAVHGRRRDLLTILGMGMASGVLALLVPIITGRIFGYVIPDADRGQLLQMTLGLVAAAMTIAAFQLTRSIAVLRLTGKLDGTLQTAVWDRLLTLPISFYRRYAVGDLAKRSLGLDTIRNLLLGNATTSFLAAIFSLFSVALLFYYSWRLALLACALIALLIAVTVVLSFFQLRHLRASLHLQGLIASSLFGLIRGISKLHVSGAEPRAFALWAERFTQQREHTLRSQGIANAQMIFSASYPLLTAMSLFAMMGFATSLELPVSRFLAFSAAFGQFQAAALTFLPLVSSLLSMVPIYERLSPILDTPPEVDESKADPGELSGDVEFSHVSFQYQEDGPLILDDVSLRAAPGELIALAGPSGSGKSTCLRLILGFEVPRAGSIYFDGQDLPTLDIQAVRRQLGVVLQNGKPMSGDIFHNIVGNSNLGIDAAWEAARMAGLEEDIKDMPMGMHTVISEGAGTFSGGQQQRLLIARAVVRRPRLLLFDEATSALDNRTQEVVSQSLERLKATRIVVAHRLSTIRNADRIYVIDQGRVVEVGSYEELIAQGGLFARLAARQIA